MAGKLAHGPGGKLCRVNGKLARVTAPSYTCLDACTDDEGPQQFRITITGIAGDTCTNGDCEAINGTYILNYYSTCQWRSAVVPITICSIAHNMYVFVTISHSASSPYNRLVCDIYLSTTTDPCRCGLNPVYTVHTITSDDAIDCISLDMQIPKVNPYPTGCYCTLDHKFFGCNWVAMRLYIEAL